MLTAFILGLFEVTAWLVVITTIVNKVVEPGVFFVTESPGMIRRWTPDIPIRPTGWRAIFKRM